MQTIKPSNFKRSTGITISLFKEMVAVLKKKERSKPGTKPTLSIEDQLLLTLMYWREYRTLYHIGITYGVSESVASRTVHKVEDILSADKQFQLPEKKKITRSKPEYYLIAIDSSEIPIQRPKKNSKNSIRAKRSSTRSKSSSR